jgi:Protein of unknown function (DUF742)
VTQVPDEPGALWYDDEAGPMVRPYTVTRGRTCAADGAPAIDMIAIVSLAGREDRERAAADEPAGGSGPGAAGGERAALGGEAAGRDGEGPADGRDGERGAVGGGARSGPGGAGVEPADGAGAGAAEGEAGAGGAGPSPEDVPPPSRLDPLGDEHIALLDMCRSCGPLSVAELAAEADLPLGVVRVLLGDLLDAGRIRITQPVPPAELPGVELLNHVINGLKSL